MTFNTTTHLRDHLVSTDPMARKGSRVTYTQSGLVLTGLSSTSQSHISSGPAPAGRVVTICGLLWVSGVFVASGQVTVDSNSLAST